MAFGNKVTDFAQVAVGTYGYIIKSNLYPYFPRDVESVQVQPASDETPAPFSTNSSIDDVNSYMEDSACPNCAWHYSNGFLRIFFKTTVYAYVDSTRFSVIGKRNTQPVIGDTILCDFMDRDLDLVQLYMLRLAYLWRSGKVPYPIVKTVEDKEEAIENES